VFLFGAVYLLVHFKQPASEEEAVQGIKEHLKPLMEQKHDWVPATASQFKHLDLAFYDDGQRFLEQQGFRVLGDEENVTLRMPGNPRTFVRILLSKDQIITGGLYHFKPGWMLRVLSARDAKVMDLETWFSDGSFVCTSNAELAAKLDFPPSIDAL